MRSTDTQTDLERARTGRHVPVLDGVRGLAILLVLVFHSVLYGGMRPDTTVDRLVHRLASGGWTGVDLFFVLSGFLITGILLDSKSGSHYFRSFYVRRVLRIFPLYFAFLFAFLWVLPQFYGMGPNFESLRQEQAWYWSYLVNVRVALEGWPKYLALGHFWSLAVEEQFYLVWPLVVFVCRRETLAKVCIACIALPFLLRLGLALRGEFTAANVLTFARLDTLALGGLVAIHIRGTARLDRVVRSAWPMTAALLSIAALFVWYRARWADSPLVFALAFTVISLTAVSVVATLLVAPPTALAARVFRHPILRFLGKYSYAIYVLHHPLVIFLGQSRLAVGHWPRLFGTQLPGQVVVFLICTGLSIVIALASWHLLEAPFLRLKRFFPYGER